MPNLNILYVVGFDLDRNTGRNKATREKAAALAELLGRENFSLASPGSSPSRLVRYVNRLYFDLRMCALFLRLPPSTIVIERLTFLPLANAVLRRRRICMVYEVHADPANEVPFLQKSRLEQAMLHALAGNEYRNLRQADAVLYNHPDRQAQLTSKFPQPSLVFYSGANTVDFIPGDRMASRARLSLDPSATYFLFLGMIAPWHGVDLLIDIFRQPAMHSFQLLIVGASDTRYQRALRAQAGEHSNISFIDHTTLSRSADYINASDVCLLPVNQVRNSAGSPLKLYDYIACGKPVVAQAGVLGYADEVEHYGLGATTNFNDPVVAARDLEAFVRQADLAGYRQHNRQMAETVLSWRARMKSWIDFLQSSLADAHKKRSTNASL